MPEKQSEVKKIYNIGKGLKSLNYSLTFSNLHCFVNQGSVKGQTESSANGDGQYSDHTGRNQAMQTDQIVARLCLLATPAHVPPVKQDTGQFHQLLSEGSPLMDQH